MLRLKTTTVKGKVFLGPFVYDLDEEQAKQKLRRLSWQTPKHKEGEKKGKPIGMAKMEFIEVDGYPKHAIFDKNSLIWAFEDVLIYFLAKLETQWEELEVDETWMQ